MDDTSLFLEIACFGLPFLLLIGTIVFRRCCDDDVTLSSTESSAAGWGAYGDHS